MEILNTAIEWYKSGEKASVLAALKLYPKEYLEEELARRKESTIKEKDNRLQKKLDRCKAMFPIGTLIWSDDGTDKLPNLVCGEPYITSDPKCISRGCEYDMNDKNRKVIAIKTLRIYKNDVNIWNGKPDKETVILDTVLYYHDKPKTDQFHKNAFVDLHEYYLKEIKDKERALKTYQDSLEHHQKKVEEYNEKIKELNEYTPIKFDTNHIKELLKKYQ